jgi:hypothetical protein
MMLGWAPISNKTMGGCVEIMEIEGLNYLAACASSPLIRIMHLTVKCPLSDSNAPPARPR